MTFQGEFEQGRFERPECSTCKGKLREALKAKLKDSYVYKCFSC